MNGVWAEINRIVWILDKNPRLHDALYAKVVSIARMVDAY